MSITARALPTTEDIEIRLDLRISRNAHAWIGTLVCDQVDAQIMKRLARIRRNNKRARAYPEQPGELTP